MRAIALNHVSVSALNLEESARFYEEVFGLERLPTPSFNRPVIWLQLGDRQLHLFERPDDEAPLGHHFAVEVDDFEAFYVRLRERGLLDTVSIGPPRELPSGEVQMYLRDPGGNLVEIDWPDVNTLDRSIVTELGRLADERPQDPEAASASLFAGRGD